MLVRISNMHMFKRSKKRVFRQSLEKDLVFTDFITEIPGLSRLCTLKN